MMTIFFITLKEIYYESFYFVICSIFFSHLSQAATYYFRNGAAQSTSSWFNVNSPTGGSNPSNFTSEGDIFIVPSGKDAVFSVSCTFGSNSANGSGVNLTINGTATINDGILVTIASKQNSGGATASSVLINGTLIFLGSSQLRIFDDGTAVPNFTTSSTAIITTQNSDGLFSSSSTSTNSIITFAGPPTYTWNNATSFVFNRSGSQILSGLPSNMKNLTLSGVGAKTMPGFDIAVSSNFTIETSVSAILVNGTNHSVNYLYLGGVGKVSGTYGRTSSIADNRDNTYFSGTGSGTGPFTGTGILTVNLSASTLPVTLSSFTAKQTTDNNVSLAWVTSSESVNKGFSIERQEEGSGKFQSLGFIPSKAEGGNSQTTLAYSFKDVTAKEGTNMYRLVQEDLDGKKTYSEVRVVKLTAQSVSNVFPNPSNGAINISRTNDGKKMNLQVLDQSGRVISQVNNITDANYRMNLPQSGIYSIKMMYPESGEQSIQRIVVQK